MFELELFHRPRLKEIKTVINWGSILEIPSYSIFGLELFNESVVKYIQRFWYSHSTWWRKSHFAEEPLDIYTKFWSQRTSFYETQTKRKCWSLRVKIWTDKPPPSIDVTEMRKYLITNGTDAQTWQTHEKRLATDVTDEPQEYYVLKSIDTKEGIRCKQPTK